MDKIRIFSVGIGLVLLIAVAAFAQEPSVKVNKSYEASSPLPQNKQTDEAAQQNIQEVFVSTEDGGSVVPMAVSLDKGTNLSELKLFITGPTLAIDEEGLMLF